MDICSSHSSLITNGGSVSYSQAGSVSVSDNYTLLKRASPLYINGDHYNDNNNKRDHINANIMPSAFGLVDTEVAILCLTDLFCPFPFVLQN